MIALQIKLTIIALKWSIRNTVPALKKSMEDKMKLGIISVVLFMMFVILSLYNATNSFANCLIDCSESYISCNNECMSTDELCQSRCENIRKQCEYNCMVAPAPSSVPLSTINPQTDTQTDQQTEQQTDQQTETQTDQQPDSQPDEEK